MAHVELGQFTPEEQQAVTAWVAGLPNGKVGLWVCGERQTGATSLAKAATRAAGLERTTIKAHELVKDLKALWFAENNARNDSGLEPWLEFVKAVDEYEALWESNTCLMIDDMRRVAVDVPFWVKHLLPSIEDRIKSGKPVVITGDSDYRIFGGGPERFFDKQFVLVQTVLR